MDFSSDRDVYMPSQGLLAAPCPSNGLQELSVDEIDFVSGGKWSWQNFGASIVAGAAGGAAGGAAAGLLVGGVGAGPGALAGGVGGGVSGGVTYVVYELLSE